jgi:hypothetical protein
MKRDMELIRELLLKLEALPMGLGDAMVITPEDPCVAVTGYDVVQINHHMDLIHEAGFIDDGGRSGGPMLGFIFRGLSWRGHEFLDTVRSPEVWRRTKEGAAKAGATGFQVVLQLAAAYGKQVVQEQLGLHLG